MRKLVSRWGAMPLALILTLALLPAPAHADTNTGTGDIGGTALTDGTFDLNSATLALIKTAFLASDDSQLTTGDNLPLGTQVKFMIYMDNNTAIQATDVTVQDDLVGAFGYVLTSMIAQEMSSTVFCPASVCDEDAIRNETETNGTALGDGDAVQLPNDVDVGSYTAAGTVLDWGDGNNANNTQLDVSADSVWAVVFTVTMQ